MDKSTGAPASNREQSLQKPAKTPSAASLKKCACSSPAPHRGIPKNTPSYKSFSHIRNPKVRRAKEYEQQLLFLQSIYPEYSVGLEDDLAYARSQQERDRVSDRDRIFKQLERSPLSCREVSEDLSLPYATTYKTLKALAEDGLVTITQRAGRAGNKPVLYFEQAHTHGSL